MQKLTAFAMIFVMGFFNFPMIGVTPTQAQDEHQHEQVDGSRNKQEREAKRKARQVSKFVEQSVHQARGRLAKSKASLESDAYRIAVEKESKKVIKDIEAKYGIEDLTALIPDLRLFVESLAIILQDPCLTPKASYVAAWGVVLGTVAWIVVNIYYPGMGGLAEALAKAIGELVGTLIHQEMCKNE